MLASASSDTETASDSGQQGRCAGRADSTSLIRPEALAAAHRSPFDGARLHQPQWVRRYALPTVALFLLTLGLVLSQPVADSVAVRGVLTRGQGEVVVRSQRAGVVESLLVEAGERVEAGDRLLVLRDPLVGADGSSQRHRAAASLRRQLATLGREAAAVTRRHDLGLETLDARRASLMQQQSAVGSERAIAAQALRAAQRDRERLGRLATAGHIAVNDAELADERLRTARLGQLQAERTLLNLQQQLRSLEAERGVKTAQRLESQFSYGGRRLALEARLAELETPDDAVRISVAGYVAALRVTPGQWVSPGQPLMTVVNGDAPLVAELAVPAAAAGQVRPGQSVRLRYDGFPYQRFGAADGVVTEAVDAALQTSAGDASMIGGPRGAVFRVRVRLAREDIRVAGRLVPLPVGMTLDADLVRDRYPVWQRLFRPLYSARERW